MSTILNSTEDTNNLNQNTFSNITSNNLIVNEHQQIDSNLTRKFLTGHRGKIKTSNMSCKDKDRWDINRGQKKIFCSFFDSCCFHGNMG